MPWGRVGNAQDLLWSSSGAWGAGLCQEPAISLVPTEEADQGPQGRVSPWRELCPGGRPAHGLRCPKEFLQPQLTEPDRSPILPQLGEAWVTQLQGWVRSVQPKSTLRGPLHTRTAQD